MIVVVEVLSDEWSMAILHNGIHLLFVGCTLNVFCMGTISKNLSGRIVQP